MSSHCRHFSGYLELGNVCRSAERSAQWRGAELSRAEHSAMHTRTHAQLERSHLIAHVSLAACIGQEEASSSSTSSSRASWNRSVLPRFSASVPYAHTHRPKAHPAGPADLPRNIEPQRWLRAVRRPYEKSIVHCCSVALLLCPAPRTHCSSSSSRSTRLPAPVGSGPLLAAPPCLWREIVCHERPD